MFTSVCQRSRKGVPQSNYLVNAHPFSNQKFDIFNKPSCKDGHLLIATNWCLRLSAGRQGLLVKDFFKEQNIILFKKIKIAD